MSEPVQTDPNRLTELICEALKDTHSTPQVMVDVFLKLAVALAVNTKEDAAPWGLVKRGLFLTLEDSFERLKKGVEAGRAAA
jgi:hypothetical protein